MGSLVLKTSKSKHRVGQMAEEAPHGQATCNSIRWRRFQSGTNQEPPKSKALEAAGLLGLTNIVFGFDQRLPNLNLWRSTKKKKSDPKSHSCELNPSLKTTKNRSVDPNCRQNNLWYILMLSNPRSSDNYCRSQALRRCPTRSAIDVFDHMKWRPSLILSILKLFLLGGLRSNFAKMSPIQT